MPTQTMLFIDEVSSTEQLSTLGDVAAHHLRRRLYTILRALLTEFNGREINFTGDGLFAAFDGASDAVSAAVAMQQVVTALNRRATADERVAIRIGVHVGEPLVSADRQELFGAAVVIARRLCDRADGDQIFVSDVTRSLAGGTDVRFEAIGPLQLKGIPEPVSAFAVDWVADSPPNVAVPEALRNQLPLTGRATESRWLEHQLERSRYGRESVIALIVGEFGSGKSALVAAFADEAVRQGATVVYGRCAGREAALSPWLEAIALWAQEQPPTERRLAAAASPPELASALGRPLASTTRAQLSSGEAPHNVTPSAAGVVAALRSLSADTPLVALIDDLEKVDDASLSVLEQLSGDQSGSVLVVGCYQGEEPALLLDRLSVDAQRRISTLTIRGLDRQAIATMIANITGAEPSSDLIDSALTETGGVPYFVRQVALKIHERRLGELLDEKAHRAESARADLHRLRSQLATGVEELEELRGAQLAEASERPIAREISIEGVACPYLGLARYEARDADRYFGRERLIAELVARLASARFVAVLGASGAGKSSLIRAGLIPALRRGALPGSERWRTAVLVPGRKPMDACITAIAEGFGVKPTAVAARLQAGDLNRLMLQHAVDRVVLVIDQAEELFTVATASERDRFLDFACSAVETSTDLVVVAVMRSDYYGHAVQHAAFAELMQESQMLVGPMTPVELRRAIERPAVRIGVTLEPGLVEAVTDDAANEPGSLPLISTALQETFERRKGLMLTLRGYSDAGGVRGAIARLAESTWEQLNDHQRLAVQWIFARLAAPSDEGIDVRRRVPRAELALTSDVEEVLDLLAERRLITIDDDHVDVAHEAILREWPRLRGWLDADRESRRFEHQLADLARAWEISDRDSDLLLRGALLAAALDHARQLRATPTTTHPFNSTEVDLLNASQAAAESELREARRSARRLRLLLLATAVGVVVAAIAGAVAFTQREQARRQAAEARLGELISQSQAELASDRDTALLLSVESYDRRPRVDTLSNLLGVLQQDPAFLGYLRPDSHFGDLTSLAQLASGKLAVTHASGDLSIFDLTTRTLVQQPVNVGAPISSSATDPAGSRLAVGTTKAVEVYDVPDLLAGKLVEVAQLAVDESPTHLTWRPDSAAIVIEGRTRTTVWNLSEQTVTSPFARPLTSVAFSNNGLVAAADSTGTTLLNSNTWTPSGNSAKAPAANFVQFMPDGRQLVTLDADGRPALRNVPGLDVVSKADTSLICSQALVVQQTFLCAEPIPRRISLFDTSTWARSTNDFDDTAGSGDILFTEQNGRPIIAVATRDQPVVKLWSLDGDGQITATIGGLNTVPVAYSSDGSRMLTAGQTYSLWDTSTLKQVGLGLRRDEERPALPNLAKIAPSGHVYIILADGSLGDYDPLTGERHSLPIPDGAQPVAIDLDSSGERLAVQVQAGGTQPVGLAAADEIIELDAKTGDILGRFGSVAERLLGYTPDGDLLGTDTTGRIVEVHSGRVVNASIPDLTQLALSPDGRFVAAGHSDGSVDVVSVRTGRVLRHIPVGRIRQATLAFSRDGSILITADNDNIVRIFDVNSGKRLGSPVSVVNPSSVIVRPDGKQIAVITARGAQVWDLDPDHLRSEACQRAGRNFTIEEWRLYFPGEAYRATCVEWPSP